MTLENNCFRDFALQLIDIAEEDDYLIAVPYRDSLEDLRLSVTFDSIKEWNNHVQSGSIEPRRQSFMRKSLAWDSAFFTSAGVLNAEELLLVNKGFKKVECNQQCLKTQKDGKRPKVATNIRGTTCQSNVLSCKKMNTCPKNKVKSDGAQKSQIPNLQGRNGMIKTSITNLQMMQEKVSSLPTLFSSKQANNASVEGSENVKTRKAGTAQDLTVSKRSRSGDLSGILKSASFTSPTTEKKSKAYRSYESSSSASSSKSLYKSIKKKVNPKNMKLVNSPSSIQYSLSSTCSSSTSPASSIDGWISESICSTTITRQSTLPVLDFESQNSVERMSLSQNITRSSIGTGPFSGGSKRKIKASGLRMPSPKIGFFDEEKMFNRSVQKHTGGPRHILHENELSRINSPCASTANCSKDGRKVSSSCSKLMPTTKELLKINLDRKRHKDDCSSFQHEKENVCSFEDQVNGICRQLEVIDLEKEFKGQQVHGVHEVLKPGQLSVSSTATEHNTPCSRTPLAKKDVW